MSQTESTNKSGRLEDLRRGAPSSSPVKDVAPPSASDSQKLAAALARQAQSERMAAQEALRFVRALQVLLRSARLYQKSHPQFTANLEEAERHLREALECISPLIFRFERGAVVLGAKTPGTLLPDSRGSLRALADDLLHRGIATLVFERTTNLGELHSFVALLHAIGHTGSAIPSDSEWPELLGRNHINSIRVNSPLEERKAGAALTSLIAAVLQLDLSTWRQGPDEAPAKSIATQPEELIPVLRLLGKVAGALREQPSSAFAAVQEDLLHTPQGTAEALRRLFNDADRVTVTMLVGSLQRQSPREAEVLEPYLSRLAETLVLEFAQVYFRDGKIGVEELRGLFEKMAREVAATGELFPGALRQSLATNGMRLLPGGIQWTEESFAEYLQQRFWEQLPVREKSAVLRGRSAWCVPTASLKSYLEQLVSAGGEREGRFVLLNFAQCLELRDVQARRAVAAGLSEFSRQVEVLWPGFLPEELSRSVLRALAAESAVDVAAVLAGITATLAATALKKNDHAEAERILEALESSPVKEQPLAARVRQDILQDAHWQPLLDAALANRALDPILPRLLGRDPTRVLENLTARLAQPRGLDALPAMARLMRAMGEAALGALVTQLYDPRTPQALYAGGAVKLLAATKPERLVEALPSALAGWEWNVQDLAVAELVRLRTPGLAPALFACLAKAHPLVVPMMIDELGISKETAAVPVLLEIAGGTHERMQDVYVRIKAVEALTRMRVPAAADVCRAILRQRDGLMHVEPAGLRSAAEEALGLLENRPSSARVRATSEATVKASTNFMRPRRYLRIPLEDPLPARVLPAGARAESTEGMPARVQTISLGGAFIESNRRLNVGDAFTVFIKAGLRSIQSTAVVRNVSPNGGGVEFVHMKQDDREKLRRLISRLTRE